MREALPPTKVECLIQDKPSIFEMDSDAPFSLISLNVFYDLKSVFLLLESASIKFHSYMEHPIKVIGLAQFHVS